MPDADDTSRAITTLRQLGVPADHPALRQGRRWLLDLQNRDGGFPTFTRGWTSLPFDRSSVDITAHALVALAALGEPVRAAPLRKALRYLERTQDQRGGWPALWFGNERESEIRNFTYGTSQTIEAFAACGQQDQPAARRGVKRLLQLQNEDGGWGGADGLPSTPEETAVAVAALAGIEKARAAARRGAHWLADRQSAAGTWTPTPIGLYFARLWYYERLYPAAFGLRALALVQQEPQNRCADPRPPRRTTAPTAANGAIAP